MLSSGIASLRDDLQQIERFHHHRSGGLLRLTKPQQDFLDSDLPLLVFWGANGIGKSVVLAEDVRLFLGGMHPQQTSPPPVEVGLFGETWHQLGTTIKYLWERIDKRWFRERLRFEGGQLAGQRYAVYDVIDGPGKGGTLHMGTFSAGARRLAGPRYHRVVTDEPMPADVFGELWPRLLGRGGHMRIGFTPTLGTHHRLEHLWTLVDDPDKPWAGEIQVPLTRAAVTPLGGLGQPPWMSDEEIERFSDGLLPHEKDCRLGLSRVPITSGRFFVAYGGHLVKKFSREDVVEHGGDVLVGIDHGSKPGAQRAVLIVVSMIGGHPHVWVLGEYYGEGRTSTEQDAQGILDLLQSWNVSLSDVDRVIGDRAHKGDKFGGYKSNRKLINSIARLKGTRRQKLPKAWRNIYTPRKYDRSVYDGCEVLHRLMIAQPPRITFHEDAKHLCEDMAEWRGSFIDPHKDGIDALRYAVVSGTHEKRR